MAHLCGPPCAATDESVQRPGLSLEGEHDVESTARAQHASNLAQDQLGLLDMLEHVEDPYRIELSVGIRQLLGFRHPEHHALRRRLGDGERRAAHVASGNIQVRSFALDGFGHRPRAAADVEDLAPHRLEVGEEVAKLQAVHEPRPRAKDCRAPTLGLVVERLSQGLGYLAAPNNLKRSGPRRPPARASGRPR